MSRPYRARALAAVLLSAAAGCQDYNFNPVGHCMLQPGTQRFTLSNLSSADVLFVVDDSGSMAGEQQQLADAFSDFVQNLTNTNVNRARGGLLPLDFHVAVTTTSIFSNRQPNGSTPICRSDCAGASGTLACCVGNQPVYGPRRCTTASAGAAQCPVSGTDCRNTCNGLKGELYCCAADGSFPPAAIGAAGGQVVTCSVENLPCGDLETHYTWIDSQCTATTRGVSLDGFPYPDGAFVGSTDVVAAQANPRVLHFDKRLYLSDKPSTPGKNAQGFTSEELQAFFRQNVRVGTCGSPQEQGLQAGRRAVERAVAGTQLDTYPYDYAAGLTQGASARAPSTFSAPGGVPTLTTPAVWPTPGSKLVVVYVGDEDDCSSPRDPAGGVLLLNTDHAGQDACTRDEAEAPPLGGKEYAVSSFVSYLTGLGRPLGAAFVVSANSSGDPQSCSGDTCQPGICCDKAGVAKAASQLWSTDPTYATSICPGLAEPGCGPWTDPQSAPSACLTSTCKCSYDVYGGQAPGTRFIAASKQLRTAGADVVVGSICGDFRPLLREVAEIVKPPQTLTLPTVPAEGGIALLRIAGGDGQTRKLCGRPLVPSASYTTFTDAEATGADWWFVASADPGPPYNPGGAATVVVPSKFVYINPRGLCIANPGETYSLDYLGVVPPSRGAGDPGGCTVQPGDADGNGVVLGSSDCQAKLGGKFIDWECYVPPGLTTGTCQCRNGG
jgi:hypothetical protein